MKLKSSRAPLATRVALICLAGTLLLGACRPGPEYQDRFTIPGNAWKSDFRPEFSVSIDDTTSLYQMFLILRHTEAYRYQNIWINLDSKSPGDTSFRIQRTEVTLAAPNGQWLGRGLSGLYEQRVPVNGPFRFNRTGDYVWRLTHDMRDDPLPEIMTVGIRLEKTRLPPQAGGPQ